MRAHFIRGAENPKRSMNVGLKAVIYNKLKNFFDKEIILSGRRGMASFFSFFPDNKGNYCFEAPITKTWMEEILKEHGFDEYLEFPGEYINKQKIPQFYTLSFKIKKPFVEFFNAVRARDFNFQTESVNFERGIDPMDSMKLGNYHKRQLEQAREKLKEIFGKIEKEYGGKTRVYRALDTAETGIRAIWNPPSAPYNYGVNFFLNKEEDQYYYTPFKYNKPGEQFTNIFYGERRDPEEAARELLAQWGGQQLVDQWGETNEAVNFERGMEPKRSMKIGKHRNDLFNEIPSMSFKKAMETFNDLGSQNDKLILSLAANMLGVSEPEVLIAMETNKFDYVSVDTPTLDSFLERQWEYAEEDSLESGSMSFDLIGSSTGEIYVKNRRTDDIIYVLGSRT